MSLSTAEVVPLWENKTSTGKRIKTQLSASQASAWVIKPENCFAVPFSAVREVKGNLW